jgi:hypothetical protein
MICLPMSGFRIERLRTGYIPGPRIHDVPLRRSSPAPLTLTGLI